MHPPGITGEEEEEATKRRRNRLQNVTIFAIPFRIPLDITLMRRFQVGSLTPSYNFCILWTQAQAPFSMVAKKYGH